MRKEGEGRREEGGGNEEGGDRNIINPGWINRDIRAGAGIH